VARLPSVCKAPGNKQETQEKEEETGLRGEAFWGW
jgi:hypothetical protein